jgi:superfamily II DNA helicase RecQ
MYDMYSMIQGCGNCKYVQKTIYTKERASFSLDALISKGIRRSSCYNTETLAKVENKTCILERNLQIQTSSQGEVDDEHGQSIIRCLNTPSKLPDNEMIKQPINYFVQSHKNYLPTYQPAKHHPHTSKPQDISPPRNIMNPRQHNFPQTDR